MLMSNAVKCKKYRNRKKNATLKIKKTSLTSAERVRNYRLRKKQLAQAINSCANEALYTASTSKTFQPSSQPGTAVSNSPGQVDDFVNTKVEENSNQINDDANNVGDSNDVDDANAVGYSSAKECDEGNAKGSIENFHLFNSEKEICAVCEDIFDSESELKLHLANHEKPYKCRFCVMVYDIYYFFKHHMLTHVSGGLIQTTKPKNQQKAPMFKCDMCQKEYRNKMSLRKHIMWHNGTNKKHKCDRCTRSFNDNTNLKAHKMAVHDKIRPYQCTECPTRFTAKNALKIHYRKHTGERPFQCNLCPEAFISSSDLRVHTRKHFLPPHDPNFKYACKNCDAKFHHRGLYLAHLKTHDTLMNLKCNICEKKFFCKYSLNRHIISHSDVKNHVCGICYQGFALKTELRSHENRIHNPNKVVTEKVQCKVCGKTVSNISNHLKTHDEKQFACELCDKRYSQGGLLNRHMKERHSGSKPFPCALCEKKYIQKKNLKEHMMKVHKTTLKTCNYKIEIEVVAKTEDFGTSN